MGRQLLGISVAGITTHSMDFLQIWAESQSSYSLQRGMKFTYLEIERYLIRHGDLAV